MNGAAQKVAGFQVSVKLEIICSECLSFVEVPCPQYLSYCSG